MVNKQDGLINRLIIIRKGLEMEWSHNGIGADC